METVTFIYNTPYRASCGIIRELDPNTGSFREIAETGVMGRFALVKQLNGFKSRQSNQGMYDEVVICQIKVSGSANKDVISHKVAGAKGEELKVRFATAWKEFQTLQKAAKTKTAENKTVEGK